MKVKDDMRQTAQRLVDEMIALSRNREINLNIKGITSGEWDVARIGQLFSNLIGNALQYSYKDTPINITVEGTDRDEIKLMFKNEGDPIPSDKMVRIFDALTRATSEGEGRIGSTRDGLKL